MRITRMIIILCVFNYSCPIRADFLSFWKDVVGGVNKAVDTVNDGFNKIGDGLKDAVNFVGDRFKDTQATRAIDYAARKAALEASLLVANATLTAAEKLSTGTLKGTKAVAELGVTAAEQFLNQVAQNATYLALKGSAEAAKGVLEGAKQTSLGVLKGSEWVVNNSLGQVDVNCIHYDGNLRDLQKLKLGNVLVRGKIIQPFEITTDLDLSNPVSTAESLAKNIGKMMEAAFIKPQTQRIEEQTKIPLDQALEKVSDAGAQADLLARQVQGLKPPAQVAQAEKAVIDAQKELAEQERKLQALAEQTQRTLEQIASKSMDEIYAYVVKNGPRSINRETRLYRQELLERKTELLQQIKNAAKKST